MKRFTSLLCLLAIFAATGWPATGRVALLVSDPAGLKAEWPLVGGVPFPPDALADAANVRVVDEAGREVPAQVEQTATWRDGDVKWIMLSFNGRPDGRYFVEYGPQVRRTPAAGGVRLEPVDGGFVVDTGTARYVIDGNGLDIESATLREGGELWSGAAGLYLVDSKARRAACRGPEAEVRWQAVVAGAERVVLRGDAHYVTPEGERVGRATLWLWFFRDLARVRAIHTFYITQDTDQLWFREIGWRIPFAAGAEGEVTFDTAKAHDAEALRTPLPPEGEVYAFQEDYPHFLERRSRFVVAKGDETLAEGAAMGEWLDVSDARRGVTVVVRDLAEQFPKELAADREGMTVRLWSSRGGKELDFRLKTLIPDYFGEWATKFPQAGKDFYRQPSNATGAAKTHELWLMPHGPRPDDGALAKVAHAADERVLLLPDPAWTCASRVFCPFEFQQKDTKRFPDAEAMMSDFFDRSVIGQKAFPTTGFIAWGVNPFLRYDRTPDGRWYAGYYRLQYLIEYNLRRNAWLMFARSGERKYYEYVSRFDWHAADWQMTHEDFGKKLRGGFARQGNYHYPVFWGDRSEDLYTECSGSDLMNWYTGYYLTGDPRSLEVVHEFRDAIKRAYAKAMEEKKFSTGAAFMTLRLLTQLYVEDWDPELEEIIRVWAGHIMDPNSPNGITDDQPYGFLYKVSRNLCSLLEYWDATGDELAKECYIKAVDYNRRFARVAPAISYQNGQAAFYTAAYRWTGDTTWLNVANALYEFGLDQFRSSPTLEEEVVPGLEKVDRLPFRGPHLNLHPLYSMPIVMKALAENQRPLGPAAYCGRYESPVKTTMVFSKPAGRAQYVEVAYDAHKEDGLDPVVLGPNGTPAEGIGMKTEALHYWKGKRIDYTPKPGAYWRVSARIDLPADAPAGDYRLSPRGNGTMIVVGSDAEGFVVEAPEGLFLGAKGVYGATYCFPSPKGADRLEFLLTRGVKMTRPDGSVVEAAAKAGRHSVETEGLDGMWQVKADFPSFFRPYGVTPAFALTPSLYFTPDSAPPPISEPRDVTPKDQYVDGVIGRARSLPRNQTITFPRGAARGDGEYDNFPGYEGTVECYFRPYWDSHELQFGDGMVYRTFLGSRSTRLYYRYGKAHMPSEVYAFVDLLVPQALKDRPGGFGTHYGISHRMFMEKNHWYHFAATWKIDPGRDQRFAKGDFAIYLDGRLQPRGRWYPHALEKVASPFLLGDPGEKIALGPMDGTLDEVRVSNVSRYSGDFEPPRQPFEPDTGTLALFHFDGSDEPYLRGDGSSGR